MKKDTAAWVGLQTIQQREALLLAPYAMHSADCRGRVHPEPRHSYRGPFQRDRDRILHSSAFRRLSGKMQVFTGDMGDYHRTRLTHTHEVASIARTIGRALRLNEDLIEALALFHDIGHPPYGHAGEEALSACLEHHGGFSHNRYALTIAQELEIRYHQFPGLNLTHEVLAGQANRAQKQAGPTPLLEVQVVELADNITYGAHDTDDALKLGLLTLDEISRIPLIRQAMRTVRRRFGPLTASLLRKAVVHELIDVQVSDVLRQAADALATAPFHTADDACRSAFRLEPGAAMHEKKCVLQAYLHDHVYRHGRLVAMRREAQCRLTRLFEALCRKDELLPNKFRRRAEFVGRERAVADYLAGMTERFCEAEYEKLVARRVVG